MPNAPSITIIENGWACLAVHCDGNGAVALWSREDPHQWFLLGNLVQSCDSAAIVPVMATSTSDFDYLAGVASNIEAAFQEHVDGLPDA